MNNLSKIQHKAVTRGDSLMRWWREEQAIRPVGNALIRCLNAMGRGFHCQWLNT